MQQTVESIKQFGVLVPGIARPLPDGTFELIAGHKDYQKGLQGLLVNYHLTFPVIKRHIIWIL